MAVINEFGMPFNDVGGDRTYSSADWRTYFDGMVISGVLGDIGNELAVTQQTVANKTVKIDTGAVLLKGAIRQIDTALNLNIADNTSGNARIDRVVARLNTTDRKLEFAVKQGTPASSPVAPTLTQTATIYELSLAKIAVANGFSSITNTNITDERTYMTYRDRVVNGLITALEADVDSALIAMNNSITPAGSVIAFAGGTAPVGYLECNGSVVSRSTYVSLFNAIGVTYGAGNGSTTFNLPDLRGEFIRGWDHGRGVDSGRINGSNQNGSTVSGGSIVDQVDNQTTSSAFTPNSNSTSRTNGDVRPRNIAMMYCIKY